MMRSIHTLVGVLAFTLAGCIPASSWAGLLEMVKWDKPTQFQSNVVSRLVSSKESDKVAEEKALAVTNGDGCCDGTAGCDGNACCFCAIRPCCCWRPFIGMVFLHRDNPDSYPVFTDAGGATFWDTSDYDFNTEFGIGVGLTRTLNACWDFGFYYFGVDSYLAERNLVAAIAPGTLTFNIGDGVVPVAAPTEAVSSLYGSDLHSAEFNLIYKGCYFDWLAGFRMIELNEEFRLGLRHDNQPNGFRSGYVAETDNRLFGLQVGVMPYLWQHGPWSLDGFCKAGLYNNKARAHAGLQDNSPFQFYRYINKTDHAAFVGDLGVTLGYQISPCTTFRIGYTALWIDGVALASDQLAATVNGTVPQNQNTQAAGLDPHGGTFYHGGIFGFEFCW